ncbi:MAG: FAD:protein FMN transferase [Ktedonobacterales bacterium]
MSEYRLIEQHARIMTTDVCVHLACAPDEAVAATVSIEACLEWLHEVDRHLTRFDERSELCRLNASGGEWQTVSPLLFEVIEHSLLAARASDGLFDPTLLSLIERLGYDRDFALLANGADSQMRQNEPVEGDRANHDDVGLWHGIKLDEAQCRVRLPRGARLDVGGIAKGWAADVALDRFFMAFPNVLIDVGGDMRVRGSGVDGEPWPVGIRNPRSHLVEMGEHSAVVSLASGSIACSGAIDRWWWQNGERRHHLIDPRTKRPALLWLDTMDDGGSVGNLVATATAFAPTAAHAEVAAKVALLRGYPSALHAVDAAWEQGEASGAPLVYSDAGVALLLVMGNGDVHCSNNLRAWLSASGGGGEIWLD